MNVSVPECWITKTERERERENENIKLGKDEEGSLQYKQT